MLIIGSHVSFTKDKQLLGSVEEALSYGANTFMFYTGAPQNTKRYAINSVITNKAITKMQENNIDIEKVIVHAPYIINLANDKEADKYDFSIRFLKEEIKRVEELGIKYIVLHPGSHVGLGVEKGIENIIQALNIVLEASSTVTILLETMAGKGTEIGSTFEEIAKIISGIKKKEYIGVCMDTCHVHDAGYDIVNDLDGVLDEFDKIIGLKYLKAIHINDSKNPCGAHKDRHEVIGKGYIGKDTFKKILTHPKLQGLPFVLETPQENLAGYGEEIKMLREMII